MSRIKALTAGLAAAGCLIAVAGCSSVSNSVDQSSAGSPKTFSNVAYVGWPNDWVSSMGNYTLTGSGTSKDNKPFFDTVVLFASNIVSSTNPPTTNTPALNILNSDLGETNPKGSAPDISWITGAVNSLHAQGVSVQLAILPNGGQQNGWSCSSTNATGAQTFAEQVANAVTTYGFDGISIDDEYASCSGSVTGLQTMVNAIQAQPAMKNKVITESVYYPMAYQFPTIAPSLAQVYTEDYNGTSDIDSLSQYPGVAASNFFVGISPYDPTYDVTQTNQSHCGINEAATANAVGKQLASSSTTYGGAMVFSPVQQLNGTAGQAEYYTQLAQGEYGSGATVTYPSSAPQPPAFANPCSTMNPADVTPAKPKK